MKLSWSLLGLASTLFSGLALAAPTPDYAMQTVHQFANFTWIENMAIRSNGQIVATDVAGSRIFLVDPNTSSTPVVLHQFAADTAIAGITEVADDVFYTIGSLNSTIYEFTFGLNTTTVWQVDMRAYASTGNATVTEWLTMPEVDVANGLWTLNKHAGLILISDSEAGLVWTLNVHTKEYSVTFDHPLLKPVATAHPPFGVNGVKVIGSELFFSNTNHGLIAKVPIDLSTGAVSAQPTIVTNSTPAADDFAIGADGSIWVAENVANTLVRVSPAGHVTTIAGGAKSTSLVGPVSARFGRGRWDRDVLYVSTDGLLLDPKGSPLTTDGKIVALDTRACS